MSLNENIFDESSASHWQGYPEYKESGVEWLGEIPHHWDAALLKRCLVSLKDGTHGSYERVDNGIPLLSAKNVSDGYLVIGENESLISFKDYLEINRNGYLKQGDLLLTIVGSIGRAAIFDYSEPVAFQRSVGVLRFKQTHAVKYFLYLSQAVFFQTLLQMGQSKSAQGGIYLNDLAVIPIVLPPPEEQAQIAAFLDRETGRIDNLIAKKERLIELLQEQRSAIISHAVTKGLNPDASMRDSGIEWLGEIPAHWEVIRLRHLSSLIQTGPFGSQLHSDEYIENGIPVINPSHIINGSIVPDYTVTVDNEVVERLERHKLNTNDIIFARRGEMGRCGLVTHNEVGWLCGTGSILLRPVQRLVFSPYLNVILSQRGIAEELELVSVGATMNNLNTQIIGELSVPIPPVDEQEEIINSLDNKIHHLDDIRFKTTATIEKLQEYRTALISAAVTGKIDVRRE